MLVFSLAETPDGRTRLRVYRLSRGRRWLCHDMTAPPDQVLDELRELQRPPPTAWWLEEWRGSGV